jgi:hypothetical protein
MARVVNTTDGLMKGARGAEAARVRNGQLREFMMRDKSPAMVSLVIPNTPRPAANKGNQCSRNAAAKYLRISNHDRIEDTTLSQQCWALTI